VDDAAAVLREELAAFLAPPRFNWCSYMSLTFRDDQLPKKGALNHFKILTRMIKEWHETEQRAFVCEEYGRSFGRVHLHALVEHPILPLARIKTRWDDAKGYADIKQFNPALGAIHYVTKYIVKDSADLGEWRIVSTRDLDGEADWTVIPQLTGYDLWKKEIAGCPIPQPPAARRIPRY